MTSEFHRTYVYKLRVVVLFDNFYVYSCNQIHTYVQKSTFFFGFVTKILFIFLFTTFFVT